MNGKYDEGRAAIAKADIDLDTAVVDLVAVDDTYVFDATHDATDLTGILDTAAGLANQAVDTEGWFSTDEAVFTGLTVGENVAGFVLRVQSGVLLAFYDTVTGDQPVNIEGDGTNVTIYPPSDGWYRV
jgi:hypothetical protein